MTRTPLLLLLLAFIGAVSSLEFEESFPDFLEKREPEESPRSFEFPEAVPDFLAKRESPPQARTCTANGRTYHEGQTFKIACNTCRCTNGQAACTRMACTGPEWCSHAGKYYKKNDRFALNINTTCTCLGADRIGCQTMPKCYFNGQLYDTKAKFRNGCNFCACVTSNLVYCSMLDCRRPRLGCTHQGKTYTNGQTFMDRCNLCVCSNRVLVCSQLTCV